MNIDQINTLSVSLSVSLSFSPTVSVHTEKHTENVQKDRLRKRNTDSDIDRQTDIQKDTIFPSSTQQAYNRETLTNPTASNAHKSMQEKLSNDWL